MDHITATVAQERINVLLLDDNAFARSIAQRALRAAGVTTIVEVASGQEAIDILKRPDHAIDVIFCDLIMPDMDGVQIIRHMAALPIRPAVVLVSGASTSLLHTAEDTARARGLRVLGVIEKPLTADAVRRVLTRLHGKRALAETREAVKVTTRELELALEKNQFLLHFQPKISVINNTVTGFESLVRWEHPDRGLIPPGAFIDAAEKGGCIAALTDKITTLALRQSAIWAELGLRPKISVNLSAYMLVDLELPDRMSREVKECDIDPAQIILEITESGLFQDAANTLEILARLHMKGFPLSIDDFGTGYSSMEQLRRVPFAEMKIDRAFVNGAAENPKAMAILESSAHLGRSLKMTVVAEGVETQEDWNAVQAAGVDLVQGYFIAKPMAADQVQGWLTQRRNLAQTSRYRSH